MPHEKIISGDLDGTGVEGHRKKITGGEFPRKEDKKGSEIHDGTEEQIETRPEKSKMKDSGDPFYTGFGSSKPRSETSPEKKSVIGGGSDIFDTGFGSATQKKREKIVHAGDSVRDRRDENRQNPTKSGSSSLFDAGEHDDIFESSKHSFDKEPGSVKEERSKSSSMDKDPFYTGFGYTDQRGKESPADNGLFPEGDVIPRMPKREPVPPKDRVKEATEDEPENFEDIQQEEPKIEERNKRSSVLTRNDDDLFS